MPEERDPEAEEERMARPQDVTGWPDPAPEPKKEPSDGPKGEPPTDAEVFDRTSLIAKEENDAAATRSDPQS